MTHLVSKFRSGLMGPSHLAMLQRVETLTADVNGRLLVSGGTLTGKLTLPTSEANFVPFNIPHGVTPTTTIAGDIWTTTDSLLININGTARTVYHNGNLATVSQAEAEAGTATTSRIWTAQRVRQAIDKAAFQTNGAIASGIDLDTIITPGLWHQPNTAAAVAGTNYPVGLAGMLMVTADGQMVYQSYTVYNSGTIYNRVRFNTAWSPWVEMSKVGHTHSFAQVPGLQAALDAGAPLASPTLTGAPKAPTAAAGTNTTQLATTAFVTAAISTFSTGLAITGVSGLETALSQKLASDATAVAATKLATARSISLTGAVTGSVNFDGTANASLATSLTDHDQTASTIIAGAFQTGTYSFNGYVKNTQEFISSGTNGFRLASYENAVMLRKDATTFYLLVADSATDGASFNTLRPFSFNLASGRVTCANGLSASDITSSGNVSAYSDARLKTDVETITDALTMVCSMRGVRFTMNGERGVGVIAQEMRKVAPELVQANDDEAKTLSVAYGNTVGILIEAIKELKAEVDALKGVA